MVGTNARAMTLSALWLKFGLGAIGTARATRDNVHALGPPLPCRTL